MKRYIIKSAVGLVALLTLTVSGCKKFLDINDNPNSPTEATPNLILPSAQAATSLVLGGAFQVYGSMWAQYWTQNPGASQYKPIDQYSPTPSSFDRPWGSLYNDALQDLEVLVKLRDQEKNKQYAAIALVLKAYTFQLVTDAFGDAPLKDALKGDADFNPKYDTQKEIYDSIFSYIDQAQALINPASAYLPGKEDLIFGGGAEGMRQWRKFGNTLKLRAYLRISKVDAAKAEAGINKLYDAPDFLDKDASLKYASTGGNQNPLFAEIVGLNYTANLAASSTCFDIMEATHDPRIALYDVNPVTEEMLAIPQGSYLQNLRAKVSPPSYLVGANADDNRSAPAPVKFISATESQLLQAEAAARGWAKGANAKTLYTNGIKASFAAYSLIDTDDAYLNAQVAAWPAAKDKQIEAIITQKYFAMCGNQGFEAWTEWRRTGYPNIFQPSKISVFGDVPTYPQRMLYPNSEITKNGNFPGSKLITDPMWWK
jgi:hypothetical protein